MNLNPHTESYPLSIPALHLKHCPAAETMCPVADVRCDIM